MHIVVGFHEDRFDGHLNDHRRSMSFEHWQDADGHRFQRRPELLRHYARTGLHPVDPRVVNGNIHRWHRPGRILRKRRPGNVHVKSVVTSGQPRLVGHSVNLGATLVDATPSVAPKVAEEFYGLDGRTHQWKTDFECDGDLSTVGPNQTAHHDSRLRIGFRIDSGDQRVQFVFVEVSVDCY